MVGREVELEATNIAHGGISVARHDGRVVFVADTVPGERVLARITDDSKKRFWRADTLRPIDASEHRVDHVWASASVTRDPAERAGGAEFGHIALPQQRELKRRVLTDALSRMAGIDHDVEVEPLPGSGDGTGWRTRVRLHVDDDGRVGPFAARSRRVIPVDDLPLATREVRELAPLGDNYAGASEVSVIAPSTGSARLIIDRQAPSTIVEHVNGRDFRLDDSGFWQVHRHAAETLSEAVASAVDPTRFDPSAANLDLYGGVGMLAAAIGERFGAGVRITSVESDERATDHAAENLADWVGALAVSARVERWVRELRTVSPVESGRLRAATVVVDPPRSGAGVQVIDAIADVAPAQLVYVACDPVALARDAARLRERGYALAALRAFDLFPHTHHLEAVATFVRASG